MEPLTSFFEPQKPQTPPLLFKFLHLKQVKRSNRPQVPTQRHPSSRIKDAWKCRGSEQLFPPGIISEFG